MNKKNKKYLILIILLIVVVGMISMYLFRKINMKNENIFSEDFKFDSTKKIKQIENSYIELATESITKEEDNFQITIEDLYKNFSESLASVKVGDNIFFGNYEQDNDINEKENIEWIVLYKSNRNSMLLISKYILDCVPYSFIDGDVLWENSNLRKFLNEEFYQIAFDEFSKHFIMENEMSNGDNVNYKTDGGNNTIDKVFVLSESQVKKYLKRNSKSGDNRVALPTKYALNRNIYVNIDEDELYAGYSPYWLRTPGIEKDRVEVVDYNGEIFAYGELATNVETGVRPCIWIKY